MTILEFVATKRFINESSVILWRHNGDENQNSYTSIWDLKDNMREALANFHIGDKIYVPYGKFWAELSRESIVLEVEKLLKELQILPHNLLGYMERRMEVLLKELEEGV